MEQEAIKIIEGEIVKDALMEYYTVVHTYDGYGWYATGIMSTSKEEALKSFGGWSGIKDFRIIKLQLPVLLRTDIKA
jgi:hypothetical protein